MPDWRVQFIADCRERIADGEDFLAQAEGGRLPLFRIENGNRIDETPVLIERERAGITSMKALVAKAEAELANANRT